MEKMLLTHIYEQAQNNNNSLKKVMVKISFKGHVRNEEVVKYGEQK